MAVETARYFVGFVDDYYVKPTFHFHYVGFSFVQALPPQGMYAVFGLLTVAAALVSLGLFFRFSCWAFFILYSYVFLVEKACYNNHYYLICLLSLLLANTDANKIASVDSLIASKTKSQKETKTDLVEAWQLWTLKLQMVVVYFYAGVAKLNADWLKGEPMRMWLTDRAQRFPPLTSMFTASWAPYFFSYGGLWLDLSVGFLLLFKPTRVFAILMLGFFHIANHFLFGIGIFPFLALASTVLFIEPESAKRILSFGKKKAVAESQTDSASPESLNSDSCDANSTQLNSSSRKKAIVGCLAVYFALQIFLPLRHWFYGGNVSWTEEGHNFSWHMKLRDKKGIRPYFTVIENGVAREVDPKSVLTRRQLGEMNGDPDLVLEFAHYLRDESMKKGVKHPVVIASIYSSINGRPYQRLVHESVDLARVEKNVFCHSPWIVPLAYSIPNNCPSMAYWFCGLAVVFVVVSVFFLKRKNSKFLTCLFAGHALFLLLCCLILIKDP